MKRITCQCGQPATMQSQVWPSIQICHSCYKKLGEYMIRNCADLLDGNPLAVELLGLERLGDRYRIWVTDESFVSKEYYFLDSTNDS